LKIAEYLNLENRFRMLTKSKPEEARKYFEQAQLDVEMRWKLYQYMASRPLGGDSKPLTQVTPHQPQE
jgi:pyruvate-ferredoxin/flavodoxin oxidoreductase